MAQPMPILNDSPTVEIELIADIRDRTRVGVETYGTPLQPHNGRDALQDAYEEALDLCFYLKQALMERQKEQS